MCGWSNPFHIKRGKGIDKGDDVSQLLLKAGSLLVRQLKPGQAGDIGYINFGDGISFPFAHSPDGGVYNTNCQVQGSKPVHQKPFKRPEEQNRSRPKGRVSRRPEEQIETRSLSGSDVRCGFPPCSAECRTCAHDGGPADHQEGAWS